MALLAETMRESQQRAAQTLGFLREVATAHLVAEVDGVVVGRSNVARTPMMPADTVALNVGVTAAARRKGVGSALFDRTSQEVPKGTRRVLGFSDDRDDDVVLPWLAARGFVPFQHSIESGLDLRGRPSVPDRDRGGLVVEIIDPFDVADDVDVASLFEESDTSPEADAIGRMAWTGQLDSVRKYQTEAVLVLARDSGRPVSRSLAQRTDNRRWRVLYTGVRPVDRGQALGRYAKVVLHAELEQRGAERVETDNEAANTGIRHVNEQLGYVRTSGHRRHARDLEQYPLP